MNDSNMLHTPEPTRIQARFRKVTYWIEGILWLAVAIGMLLFTESWEGTRSFYLIPTTLLALLYLVFSFLITGATGKTQILLAAVAGFAWALRLFAFEFILESWAGGRDMLFISKIIWGIVALAVLYQLYQTRAKGEGARFCWHVLLRGFLMLGLF